MLAELLELKLVYSLHGPDLRPLDISSFGLVPNNERQVSHKGDIWCAAVTFLH